MKVINHSDPTVSVLLPVHNGEKYLSSAIKSILDQTYRDIEFLIIDDASNDRSWEIARAYKDSRIKLFNNETNLGIAKSLHKLIDEAKGEYIARMDADDISLPMRLEKQVSYLKTHPDVGLLGTGIHKLSNGEISRQTWLYPCGNINIQWALFFRCPFAHPTIMANRSLIICAGNYDHRPAEDWDLWERMSWLTQMDNLPEALLMLRKHETNITRTRYEALRADSAAIIERRIIRMVGAGEGYDLSKKILSIMFNEIGSVSEFVPALNHLYEVFSRRFEFNRIQRREVLSEIARLIFKAGFRPNIKASERIYAFLKAHYYDPTVEIGFIRNIITTVKR